MYVYLLMWWKTARLKKDLDNELRIFSKGSLHEIYQDDTQRKYFEGLSKVKKTINAKATTKEEYEKALGSIKELLSLARDETPSQRALRKILKSSLTRSGKDIKTDKDKRNMIQERIGHYEELRKYNEERAIIKEIKQTRKEGNETLATELEDKWRIKYGKIRNSGRR